MTFRAAWLVLLMFAVVERAIAQSWPDTVQGRQAAAAALLRFEAELDASDSATLVLGRWCADHAMATPPSIQAVRDRALDKPADRTVRRLLRAGQGEVLRYRRVRLACGSHVLSEADNWYRPARLTADMNSRLETTDTPFGVVVRDLKFHRRTLDVRWLFHPLEARPRRGAGGLLAIPHAVLRHRAVLADGEGAPFSLVVETYTGEVLAFEAQPPAFAVSR